MKENILIAQCMGMWADPIDKSVMIKMTPQGNEVVPVESLNYHNDWNWLMPVVSECRVQSNSEDSYWKAICYSLEDCEIDVTYKAVVQFIKTTKIETESNELIAEFMDMEDHQEMGKYVTPNYHNSWDWLMPVVDKIENFGFEFIISENRVKIKHNTDHSIEELFHSETIGSKLNTTYKAVVEFIKEFNK